jgi:hypothetical protein
MTLQIYGHPIHLYSACIHGTQRERRRCEFEIQLFKGKQKAAKYVARLHPIAKVSVFVDHETGLQIFGRYD